ncbi:MAG: hypothetical protein A2Z08_07135 [Deltaproteobacteria bacterium RBG_16_54_11]|nr:MAG: hypothetical protein A2Z08_07135 [Deltaproteobacteria bacterium RBG_16_54_11]
MDGAQSYPYIVVRLSVVGSSLKSCEIVNFPGTISRKYSERIKGNPDSRRDWLGFRLVREAIKKK